MKSFLDLVGMGFEGPNVQRALTHHAGDFDGALNQLVVEMALQSEDAFRPVTGSRR